MEKTELLKELTAQKSALASFGVKSLAIFGSVARNESKPDSDLDVLVEFQGKATFSQYIKLRFYLQDLMGCPVDLVTRKGIRPEMLPSIEKEALYVT